MATNERIIGIDLGTTNSVVAVMEGGEAQVITNEEGSRTTPSVVAITDKGERLVGASAKRQAVTNPKNTVYSIKRFMGRRISEVGEEIKQVPYEVTGSGAVSVKVQGKEYAPPEISAMVLGKLKKAAEDYLGQKVTAAVITVPPTSTTPSARPPRTRARSRGWMSSASSTSPPPRPWPMVWTRRATRSSRSLTLAAAPLTSRCWRWATASSRSNPPTATPTWAARTSTRRSSIGWLTEFKKDQGS